MNDFENPIDKIIREVREKGDFDQLPGKGKPIRWEDETFVPEDKRLANRLLKHNNFTLDWIALGQELDQDYEQIQHDLQLLRAERAAGHLNAEQWSTGARRLVTKLDELNKRVLRYNLRVPHEQFQRRPFPIDPDIKDETG